MISTLVAPNDAGCDLMDTTWSESVWKFAFICCGRVPELLEKIVGNTQVNCTMDLLAARPLRTHKDV